LAEQLNLVITDNANGDLVYQQVVESGSPVAYLQEGLSPLVSVSVKFNSQEWYSDVIGARAVKFSSSGSETFPVHNPFLDGVFRPYYFRVKDVDGPVDVATRSKFARMLANVATYSCEVNTWRDASGNLFKPNTLIDIEAPSAMVYSRYRFLISQVDLKQTANNKSSVLKLSFVGSYTGTSTPRSLPWGS
jgi:prophage tail gpP-like protein